MVKSEARELTEETMLKAVMAGHSGFQPVIQAIIRLAEKAAKEPRELNTRDHSAVEKAVLEVGEADLRAAYSITQKQERYAAVDAVKAKVMAALAPEGAEPKFPLDDIGEAFHNAQAKVVRWNILDHKRRIDGRDLATVRPILAEVESFPALTAPLCSRVAKLRRSLLRRRHWRGRAMSIAGRDLQGAVSAPLQLPALFRGRDGPHGLAGPMRNRPLEVAWRAIHPMLPTAAELSGTVRVVSEITELKIILDGDGQRLVSGADGRGRTAVRPTAGIAMGLILEGGRFEVLSDILAMRIISATWISRSRAPARGSLRCKWTSRSPA